MFADDTKVHRELSNITRDSEALQLEVDHLLSWASTWQQRFNPDKCEVLRVTHKRDLSIPTYSLCTSIKSIKCVKDLGITISSDLSWSEHVNVTVNKANKLLGLVYRAEGSSNSGTFSTLYKSLVRPILEYAAAVWNPYLVKDVLALERVHSNMMNGWLVRPTLSRQRQTCAIIIIIIIIIIIVIIIIIMNLSLCELHLAVKNPQC